MTISHIDPALKINQHNRTEFGLPVLPDMESTEDWWSQHEGARLDSPASIEPGSIVLIAAAIDAAAPAWCIEKFSGSLREPDFFDDGHAFWLTPDAVVYVDATRIDQVQGILASAERLRHYSTENSTGWVRVHPSHYGIQVEWFDGSAHPAHMSWEYVTNACITQYDNNMMEVVR